MMNIDVNNDREYANIVNHILNNQEFSKIKNIEHHGTTRYLHSLRVSYYSYKISKFLHLSYKDTARAGLLHDFFLSKEDRNFFGRFISTFTHPKKAVEHTSEHFDINDKEADIIKAHMFPFYVSMPKYAESWIVNSVDKVVGMVEFSKKFGYKFSYATNIALVFLVNMMK